MISLLLLAAAAPIPVTTSQSREVMRDYAECMARSYNRDARVLVAIDDTAVVTPAQLKMFRSDCLSRTGASMLKGSHSLYRFALAEALLRRDYRKAGPPNPALAAPIDHPIFAASATPPSTWVEEVDSQTRWPGYRDRARAYSVVSAFGDCVVRAGPAKAWALLQTKVASAPEKAALAALAPEMGSCVPAGAQIELSPNNIRGTVALNYYRLSQAPRAAAAGGNR
ncbi:MAG: hypothetical protein ABIU10_08070 [Sphingomicrobium sp.]